MKLSLAENLADEMPMRAGIAASAIPVPVLVQTPRSRYGERRAPNYVAIVITAALHAAALAGILYVRYDAPPERKEETLTMVDLSPPPPPPAPETPPAPPQLMAPKPPIAVPRPVTVAVAPEPVLHDLPPVAAPVPVPAPPAPPASTGVVSGADLSARMVSGAPPRYPIESRRRKEQGTVVLAVTLDIDGRVASISVARSSGHERLDDAALSAVRKWRWQPLVKDGKTVMVKGQVEIPFVLAA